MRLLHAACAVAALAGVTAALAVGGRSLAPPRTASLAPASARPVGNPVPGQIGPDHTTAARARPVAGDLVVPLQPGGAANLERVEPRGPLSELAVAHPPEPQVADEDWQGRILPRPTAVAAGILESKGFHVALAGIEPAQPDQTCSYGGRDWACGRYARTAFRAFLRGRSVTCDIPKDASPGRIEARCRIGKQDLAAWLVVNGWAKAGQDSPLADQNAKAEKSRKGVFGPPPVSAAEQPREIRSDP